MLKGFRDFIMKGNVVDMAVGVVIGVSFGAVVTAMVKDLITPLIGVFGGTPDFSGVSFTLNNSKFYVGDFLNTLISFLLLSAVIYFAVILPMNRLTKKMKGDVKPEPTEKQCAECLSMIPIKAMRCKFCTALQESN